MTTALRGVFPVMPTVFDDRGELYLDGQRRAADFMIDAGSEGLCNLANFSEQFVLADDERKRIMELVLDHVAGRVPVIVTTTHFSSRLCAERSHRAMAARTAMVMPPGMVPRSVYRTRTFSNHSGWFRTQSTSRS